jgi:hypothetical protein
LIGATSAWSSTNRNLATASPFGCRATIAGHQWLLTGNGFTCASAAAVIKPLAKGKSPGPRFFPGLHGGMQCATTTPAGKPPVFIGCANGAHSKSITAIQG